MRSGPAAVGRRERPANSSRTRDAWHVVLRGGAMTYVAVWIVGIAGATMLCVCAPPSDHDENSYVVPARICGDIALIEFEEPTMTVRVNGVVADSAFTVSCNPGGTEGNVRSTVSDPAGRSSYREPRQHPSPSVASRDTRGTRDPALRTSHFRRRSSSGSWAWQFDGQCWSSNVHESDEAGSVPARDRSRVPRMR